MTKRTIILNAVGESLREGGNCPYDPECQFSRGSNCSAPKDVLDTKIKAIKESINTPGQLAFHILEDASIWGCENIGIVRFVDPDGY